jgi:amino acid transporter
LNSFQGEESKNPQRAIPMSICLTLLVCSIIYCAVSIVITLMVNRSFIFNQIIRIDHHVLPVRNPKGKKVD